MGFWLPLAISAAFTLASTAIQYYTASEKADELKEARQDLINLENRATDIKAGELKRKNAAVIRAVISEQRSRGATQGRSQETPGEQRRTTVKESILAGQQSYVEETAASSKAIGAQHVKIADIESDPGSMVVAGVSSLLGIGAGGFSQVAVSNKGKAGPEWDKFTKSLGF
jgi:hypothetical protein